jgi:hypothetical protein
MAKLGMHLNQLISDKLIEKVEENQDVIRYNINFSAKWLYLVKDKISDLWFLERRTEKGKLIQSKSTDLYMLNF